MAGGAGEKLALTLKRRDIVITIIAVFLTLVCCVWVFSITKTVKQGQVMIYINNQLVPGAPYDLTVEQELTFYKSDYPVLLADLTVSIKNNKVAVIYEESPRNYCSNMGYIGLKNFPIVCLPNKTMVVITGEGYYV